MSNAKRQLDFQTGAKIVPNNMDRLNELTERIKGLKALLARRQASNCHTDTLATISKQIADAEEDYRVTRRAYGL
jgi:hypothetical protein